MQNFIKFLKLFIDHILLWISSLGGLIFCLIDNQDFGVIGYAILLLVIPKLIAAEMEIREYQKIVCIQEEKLYLANEEKRYLRACSIALKNKGGNKSA